MERLGTAEQFFRLKIRSILDVSVQVWVGGAVLGSGSKEGWAFGARLEGGSHPQRPSLHPHHILSPFLHSRSSPWPLISTLLTHQTQCPNSHKCAPVPAPNPPPYVPQTQSPPHNQTDPGKCLFATARGAIS